MRVHVALTPADASGLALKGWAAMVVDVLRATTTVVAACAAGCLRVVPVADPGAARERAGLFPPEEILLAGEQGGEPIAGFDLGNSPLEFTADRVRGKTILLTTTNGTAAMRRAATATTAAVAALTNVSASARWALGGGRDLVVLCSGDDGAFSIEDAVCAGLVVARLSASGADLSDGAAAALGLGRHYAPRLEDLRHASRWARRLARMGHSADVDACLRQDVVDMVPIVRTGVIVPGPALAGPGGERSAWSWRGPEGAVRMPAPPGTPSLGSAEARPSSEDLAR